MGLYNHQLETFLTVADSGSFRQAAELLFISPTAVQKQINLLEESLQARLFHRSHNGLILTGPGKSLYADAKYLLSFSTEAERRLLTYRETEYTEIRAAFSPISPLLYLNALWPYICKADSSFRLILVPKNDDPTTKKESIRNIGISIDIIETAYDEEKCIENGLGYLCLDMIPMGFILPDYHPLAEKRMISLYDLETSNTKLIIPRRGLNKYADQVRDELVERRTVRIIEIDDYTVESYNICIRENCALLSLNPTAVHPLLTYKKAAWDFTVPYGLLYSDSCSPFIRDFIRLIHLQLDNPSVKEEMRRFLP